MTNCHNCGNSETFVLLVQFALAIPGPDVPTDETSSDAPDEASNRVEGRSDDAAHRRLPSSGDLSLAVQCPACDSTDVGLAADELLARYGSSTTS